jgi:hypothetical protein
MLSYRQNGTVLTDHTFSVPLDHDRGGGELIEVFAREVVAADRDPSGLPWLLFLQGGPGHGGPRLSGRSSWLRRALTDWPAVAAPATRPPTCRSSGPTRSSVTPS